MFAIKPVGDPCCDPPLVGNTLNYSLACLGGSCIVAFAECHEKLYANIGQKSCEPTRALPYKCR